MQSKDFQPLRECPFCGGEARIKSRYIGYGSVGLGARDWYTVECNECRAKSDEYGAELEAIAAWNCRAQPSEKPEPLTLGELRQMGGEPIWIKEFPPYAFAGYKVLSLRVVDVYGDIVCEDGDIYEYERYGKTWLAYRSKPKEEV